VCDESIVSVDDALASMSAALDVLLAADPAALAGRHRDVLTQFVAQRNRADAVLLRLTEVLDSGEEWTLDGAVTAKSWMRAHLRMAPSTAAAQVRTARRARDLPQLREALAEGAVSLRHVEVVANAMGRNAERRDTVAEAEPTFARAARELDPVALHHVVSRWKHAVDPLGEIRAENDAHARRFLSISSTFEGVVVINGALAPEQGAVVRTALEVLCETGYRTERGERLAAAHGHDDAPTPAQRRADALVDLARRYLDRGDVPEVMGLRPHVEVTVQAGSLEAPRGEPGHSPGELRGAGPISTEAVRRIACDARVTGFTVDCDGRPVSYGRTRRTIPGGLRRYLNLRDGGCVFPGCDRPVQWCEAHHLVHWAHGGPTDAANLGLLCVAHHHALHEGGFTTRGSPEERTLMFRRPDGSLLGPAQHRGPPLADTG
jgi:hypothetical protein